MDQLETMIGVAVGTKGGLSYAASINLNGRRKRTNHTFKKGFSHFGNDVRYTDDHSAYGNKLINVLGVKGAHVSVDLSVEWSNLKKIVE